MDYVTALMTDLVLLFKRHFSHDTTEILLTQEKIKSIFFLLL